MALSPTRRCSNAPFARPLQLTGASFILPPHQTSMCPRPAIAGSARPVRSPTARVASARSFSASFPSKLKPSLPPPLPLIAMPGSASARSSTGTLPACVVPSMRNGPQVWPARLNAGNGDRDRSVGVLEPRAAQHRARVDGPAEQRAVDLAEQRSRRGSAPAPSGAAARPARPGFHRRAARRDRAIRFRARTGHCRESASPPDASRGWAPARARRCHRHGHVAALDLDARRG